jgi:hypothetical protein
MGGAGAATRGREAAGNARLPPDAFFGRYQEASMLTFRHLGAAAIAAIFAMALAVDAADARRGGGGGGMRGGGFSGGGMRGGGFSGGGMRAGGGGAMRVGGSGGRGFASAGAGRPHPSHPIARPGGVGGPGAGTRPPGWANRPGNGTGWGGYRSGYGWGAAAALGTGLAYSAYGDPYYGSPGYADDGSNVAQSDPIAECARRFKTYDPATQTYIKRKGERASCP